MLTALLLSTLSVASAVDSDGDGLTDVQEDLDGNGNPNDDDYDGDGLPNYLDPDDDGDGLSTRSEITPSIRDTDWDMLPDYLDPDDDNDELLTWIELSMTGTDPVWPDTDHWPVIARTDGQEIKDGTDPLDPADDGSPSHVLGAPSPGQAGRVNTLTLQGATPGAVVLLFGNERQLPMVPTPVGPCPGRFSSLTNPTLVAAAVADPSGMATFRVSVPQALAGRWVQLQAVEPSVCGLSTTVIDQL